MKMSLGKYAKMMKISRYEALRRIMRKEVRYEEVMEDGKKKYYIYIEEESPKQVEEPQRIECEGAMIEIEGEYLYLYKEGRKEIYKKVSE